MDVHDLTAAYALDALDAEEAREYESHLATCKECQEELARLGSAAGALAFAVESPAPPPDLRQRILDAAVGERENVVSLRPTPLTAHDAQALVDAVSESSPLAESDVVAVAGRSGGNPLFLKDLVAAAQTAGEADALVERAEPAQPLRVLVA